MAAVDLDPALRVACGLLQAVAAGGASRQVVAATASALFNLVLQRGGEDADVEGRVHAVRDALVLQKHLGVSHLQVVDKDPDSFGLGVPARGKVRMLRRRRNRALHEGFGDDTHIIKNEPINGFGSDSGTVKVSHCAAPTSDTTDSVKAKNRDEGFVSVALEASPYAGTDTSTDAGSDVGIRACPGGGAPAIVPIISLDAGEKDGLKVDSVSVRDTGASASVANACADTTYNSGDDTSTDTSTDSPVDEILDGLRRLMRDMAFVSDLKKTCAEAAAAAAAAAAPKIQDNVKANIQDEGPCASLRGRADRP
eukprot:CAMPEP_0204516324 /NCGR_PEP_ID=MMETSP0661-20131031/3078_1 /ASSEMBLY_ACC=CAM_ASM_000606 /TAXON_ID=109239 /ORGANISM="Alexandrium margalefi, Strain AMGDE01CS-322" /LENGTH=309 /DNA_ID=CAMNT_0051521675 /DNA_START=77 /DNA_END=1006 /DNA_ORIENTATION=+